jgi:hypothetical protein
MTGKDKAMRTVKAAAVQLSPVRYSREGTVDKIVRKIHELGREGVHGWDGASRIAWRSLLATVGGAFGLVLLAAPCYAQAAAMGGAETSVSGLPSAELVGATEHGNAIRPFRINVPEETLLDLRRRVMATRWPERETIKDQSQGATTSRSTGLASRRWPLP